MQQSSSDPSALYRNQIVDEIHTATSIRNTLPQIMQKSQQMFNQISDCSGILAKNNAAIDPLCENVKNLFQQAMMTSDLEVKKQILDQANVLDGQTNQLEDASQETKHVLRNLYPDVQKHFIT